MNERIRELVKQAGGNPNYKAFRGHFLPPPPNYIDPATVDLEKFAELIVKECCDIVLAPHNETGFTISMDLCKFSTRQAIDRAAQSGGLKVHTQGISKEIKNHFGVEE